MAICLKPCGSYFLSFSPLFLFPPPFILLSFSPLSSSFLPHLFPLYLSFPHTHCSCMHMRGNYMQLLLLPLLLPHRSYALSHVPTPPFLVISNPTSYFFVCFCPTWYSSLDQGISSSSAIVNYFFQLQAVSILFTSTEDAMGRICQIPKLR